jgi:hypothetical protein
MAKPTKDIILSVFCVFGCADIRKDSGLRGGPTKMEAYETCFLGTRVDLTAAMFRGIGVRRSRRWITNGCLGLVMQGIDRSVRFVLAKAVVQNKVDASTAVEVSAIYLL